jgi:hypothetical protein
MGEEVLRVARQDPEHVVVAMVDRSGSICAVNQAWIDFGVASGVARPMAASVGTSVHQVCGGGWFRSGAPD